MSSSREPRDVAATQPRPRCAVAVKDMPMPTTTTTTTTTATTTTTTTTTTTRRRRRKTRTKSVPPDGGWGWVVLVSALTVNFLIPGTVKSFGVLFVEFLHVFKASSTAASWMPALCYFLYSSLGPLSSVLSTKYSYRTVTLIGGTFAASGMMLSYFANSVTFLYVSYGLMVGIGAGLSFPPTVYIVTSYFEKLRGLANGLCISGSAIGTIVLPPLLQYLLDCFGYRGAVLIMGAITLNTLVCGLLYHPVEQHMKIVPVDEGIDNEALTLDEQPAAESDSRDNDDDNDDDDDDDDARKRGRPSPKPSRRAAPETIDERKRRDVASERKKTGQSSVERYRQTTDAFLNSREPRDDDDNDDRTVDVETNDDAGIRMTAIQSSLAEASSEKSVAEDVAGREESSRNADARKKASTKADGKRLTRFFDLSVLKDPIYLVILISNSTSAISNTNFMILLPSYAITEGFDKNSAALLLSIVSALDLVGRIGGASLSDIDFVPKYYYFVGGLGTSGIALALLPMATSYTMLSFFCALFGLSSGMYIGITTVILADMLGTEKLSSSYGISLFVNGVLQLIGPPICGVIYENVLSYKPIFLAFGIILILGTALWAAVPVIKRNSKKDLDLEAT